MPLMFDDLPAGNQQQQGAPLMFDDLPAQKKKPATDLVSAFRSGTAQTARDIGETAKDFLPSSLGGPISAGAEKVAGAVDTPYQGGPVYDQSGFHWGNLPGAVARSLPGAIPAILLSRLGLGGMAAGAGSYAAQTMGPAAKAAAVERTGDQSAEPSAVDLAKGAGSGLLQAGAAELGAAPFNSRVLANIAGTNALGRLATKGIGGAVGAGAANLAGGGDLTSAANAAITGGAANATIGAPGAWKDARESIAYRDINTPELLGGAQRFTAGLQGNLGGRNPRSPAVGGDVFTRTMDQAHADLDSATPNGTPSDIQAMIKGLKAGQTLTPADYARVRQSLPNSPDLVDRMHDVQAGNVIQNTGVWKGGELTGGITPKLASSIGFHGGHGAFKTLMAYTLAEHAGSEIFHQSPEAIAAMGGLYALSRLRDIATGTNSPVARAINRFGAAPAAPAANPQAAAPQALLANPTFNMRGAPPAAPQIAPPQPVPTTAYPVGPNGPIAGQAPAPQPALANPRFNMGGNAPVPPQALANARARVAGLLSPPPAPGAIARPDMSGIQMPANNIAGELPAPAGMTWPHARIARMNQMLASGMSTRQVAEALGVTKNAVIGQNWRNKRAGTSPAAMGTPIPDSTVGTATESSAPAAPPAAVAEGRPSSDQTKVIRNPQPADNSIPEDLSIPAFLQRAQQVSPVQPPVITKLMKANGGAVKTTPASPNRAVVGQLMSDYAVNASRLEMPFPDKKSLTPSEGDHAIASSVVNSISRDLPPGVSGNMHRGIAANQAAIGNRVQSFAKDLGFLNPNSPMVKALDDGLRNIRRQDDAKNFVGALAAQNPSLAGPLQTYFGPKWIASVWSKKSSKPKSSAR